MSELVTGEAVVLGLRPAKLPSRALAVVIDLVVVFSVYIAVSAGLAAATASLDAAASAAVSVATFVLVLVGAPIAVETLSQGRSLGKTACGLRVMRDDGGPIRFRHALVRGAMGVVEILMTLGAVAVIASLVSARGRRLGDVFAGTLVVRECIPASRSVRMPAPPPWLAGQLGRLDLSRVPDGLWLAVRQYLTRMGQLDPQVSGQLAARLANDVTARTGVPVPDGVPSGAYLAAVAGERQARDAQRAFGAVGDGHGHASGNGVPAGARAAAPGAWWEPAATAAWAAPTGAGQSAPAESGVGARAESGGAGAPHPAENAAASPAVGPGAMHAERRAVAAASPERTQEQVNGEPARRTGFVPPA
ncbi:RDD family protein [Streptomyces sp. NPDC051776]|uniref:RDD family protein n=1 Tax=Streptomyces sp. NPDC051776 TaxID=3155414 RepID=UPI003413A9CE